MRAAIVIVAVVVVVACTGAEPDVQRVSFGPIELALPAGWTPSPKAEQRVMWTPSC